MKRMRMIMWLAVGILVLAVPAFPEATVNQGQGQAIVTILPRSNSQALGAISQKDLTVEISGHKPRITGWVPLRGSESDLEMVLLIDSSARTSLGTQLGDITNFIRTLPNQVKVAVGYMNAGRAILSGPLSTDHAEVADQLRLPGGSAGSSASPYFCLSNLAKNWPSKDASARREVVMITDGIDNYYPRFDMLDPYVNAAIQDAVRARLVVYSIYWRGQGRAQGSISRGFDGQRQLERVSQATGGISYWQGAGVPVSFGPYFQNIALRIQNQYRLSFSSQSNGKPEVRRLSVKVIGPEVNVYAPQRVFIDNSREE
jgi:hypothetical protein